MAAGCAPPCGRHEERWAVPLRPPLCLACTVETLSDGSASLVRTKHVLSRLRDALAWQALPVVQLLAPDERICIHLIGTIFERELGDPGVLLFPDRSLFCNAVGKVFERLSEILMEKTLWSK
ncbi:meiosis inhibitor protein 1-like [Podargus strigoides]